MRMKIIYILENPLLLKPVSLALLLYIIMARQEVDRGFMGLQMILEVVDKYVDNVCCWWINNSI
jgi:hypothetical protein